MLALTVTHCMLINSLSDLVTQGALIVGIVYWRGIWRQHHLAGTAISFLESALFRNE